MKKMTELMKESVDATSVELTWYPKILIYQLKGTETVSDFIEKITLALSTNYEKTINDKGFYMLIHTKPTTPNSLIKPLLYIGLAYKQKLGLRITQESGHETAYKCILQKPRGNNVYLKYGIISSGELKKSSESLFEEVECCLINTNKPECNTICKKEYSKERTIRITNKGKYKPLEEISGCISNSK